VYEAQHGEPIAADDRATNHVMQADEIEVYRVRIVEPRQLLHDHGLPDRGATFISTGLITPP
jgi:hypothetical protein